MKILFLERGRLDNKISLNTLSGKEMESVKGGSICVCDAKFCIDCSCVQAGGLCVCDVKRNCPGEEPDPIP